MATVSITQAAKLANISRATFYRKYINTGKISVLSDHHKKKKIDTSELLRVFGELKQDTETIRDTVHETAHGHLETVPKTPLKQAQSEDPAPYHVTSPNNEAALHSEVELLKTKLAAAEQQVQALQQDKAWYQSHLTDNIKLLEAPKQTRLWWQIWK